ncbi:MAG: helix-turn-helix transcriptional regulator [Alphaproteobacteria bacterium]|nr:helix-turn-helix transcriptional regulator [Alphaproteobacteria bacterium]
MLSPLRLRLLRSLHAPASAASLGRALEIPRQKLNYHLRALEGVGLVEPAGTRRRGNCTEQLYRATARSYLLAPQVLGGVSASPERIRDRFSSAYLLAVAARAIRELGALRARADAAGKRLPTATLETEIRFASPASRAAFLEELSSEVARLTAKYHDEHTPGGRRLRVFIGAHPALPPDPPETPCPTSQDPASS